MVHKKLMLILVSKMRQYFLLVVRAIYVLSVWMVGPHLSFYYAFTMNKGVTPTSHFPPSHTVYSVCVAHLHLSCAQDCLRVSLCIYVHLS